jgi:ubiquinone/menaquinone biosynthesis C-methylase UbiE
MTIEAFQYAPDKRAALGEFARILKPGGRAAIVCLKWTPRRSPDCRCSGSIPWPTTAPC